LKQNKTAKKNIQNILKVTRLIWPDYLYSIDKAKLAGFITLIPE
jgi:hypothetical protein